MNGLSEEGLGDVEVVSYRALTVGSRILLWYSDDTVWHEAMVTYLVGGHEVVILTPDDDMYVESLKCAGGEGPSRMKGLVENRRLPRSLNARAYRFHQPFTDEMLKQVYRKGLKVAEEYLDKKLSPPPVVLNQEGAAVQTDAFFGGTFVTHRVTGRGAAPGGGSTGGSPDSPKNAKKIVPAPSECVWLAAEPCPGVVLGQELSLNADNDVQVGDHTALALRSGIWIKAELVKITDVVGYADRRRQLFASGQPEGRVASPPKNDVVAEAVEEDEKPHGDVRTLWVDFDEHGERFKRWRDVCRESFTPTYDAKPLEGPATALHIIKHMERHGGDPRLWLQMWLRSKRIETTDRIYHELKVLIDCLFYAGTFDQLNIPGLMSLEVISRRIQAISDAYTNPMKPSWENAKVFTGQGSPEDIVSPTFRTYAVKKQRDELELLQARQKVRELRGSPSASVEDGAADAADALPPKAPKPPKKGRGKGQSDGA